MRNFAVSRFDINTGLKFVVTLPPNADVEKVELIRGHFFGREFKDAVILHPLFGKPDVPLIVEYAENIVHISYVKGRV